MPMTRNSAADADFQSGSGMATSESPKTWWARGAVHTPLQKATDVIEASISEWFRNESFKRKYNCYTILKNHQIPWRTKSACVEATI